MYGKSYGGGSFGGYLYWLSGFFMGMSIMLLIIGLLGYV